MPHQPHYDVTVNGALEIVIGDRPTRHQIWFNDVEHAAEIHEALGRAIELVRREQADLQDRMRQALDQI